ncbi:MAG TPA: exodeoxyribonuclease V subunit beta, partial [Desulfobacteraceae bacterium]|nr:exodeoxyribonuclease V subunit beta [Desulfobacteraceae bacterium]
MTSHDQSDNRTGPIPLDPFALDLAQITLIEASAGTGKTYTITTLFVRLLALGYPVESILVVTFTEAAAAELKLRIRRRMATCLAALEKNQRGKKQGENNEADKWDEDELIHFLCRRPDAHLILKRLRLGLTCFDLAAVMTIHSFCFSVLRDNAFESKSYFDMDLQRDNAGFLRQTAMDFFYLRVIEQDPLFLSFLHTAGMTPERLTDEFMQVVGKPHLKTVPQTAVFKAVWDAYRDTVDTLGQILRREKDEILTLIQSHKGVDKRSYSKKNLPAWLDKSLEILTGHDTTPVFSMNEKGDPLYKFTHTRLAEKTKTGQTPPDHPFFDACETLLSLSRQMEENLVALKLEFLAFYRDRLAAMKSDQGICFFDDLINDLEAALSGPGGGALQREVRGRYKACLIDEFQDTDPGQYAVFSSLFGSPDAEGAPPPFFMIGDPKQAIYAFRGGDIFAYLTASRDCRQSFTLPVNYRSAPLLVQGVNALFIRIKEPFGFSDIPFHPVTTPASATNRLSDGTGFLPPLNLVMVEREGISLDKKGCIKAAAAKSMIPGLLARDMLAVLNGEKGKQGEGTIQGLTPGDMAVLVRTNAQAEAVQQALSLVNIPSYLSKSGSVFDSPQAVAFFDLLSAVDRPENTGCLKAALVSPVYAWNEEMIRELNQDEQMLWAWQDRFRGYHDLWEEKGFVAMITALFHDEDLAPAPGSRLSERALTNFYHLIELSSQAVLHQQLERPYLLKWYQNQLHPDTREETADELRLESDARAVAIVTIHKSKGLEYPVVFLPYLWAQRSTGRNLGPALFHDPEQNFRLCLDLGSENQDEARRLMVQEADAEEMRLLYVALTRASAWCRIYWGGIAGADNTALGRLLHPQGLGDDTAVRADLKALAASDPAAISVCTVPGKDTGGVYTPDELPQAVLSARILNRRIDADWRITSYSALVAGHHGGTGTGETSEPLPETGHAAQDSGTPILLESFPKGAGAGDFFHGVLEDIDFTDDDSLAPAVSENLDRYGFKGLGLSRMAGTAIRAVLATPLNTDQGKSFRLNEVALPQRFTELEFCFDLKGLDLNAVAALFDTDPKFAAYAARLRGMDVSSFKGFLKGFIDLTVCHDGLWYILDYKSNYLGPMYEDYDHGAVTRAMADHDYILQYHL